ncbi:MAG: radical SAM protein [Oscillospiraceae bacterium]|nr:radical SAM protein [Oscillospiraceae bacterium]
MQEKQCTACPRRCMADRNKQRGFCGETNTIRIARAARHDWEEPPISGQNGSGTVFFSGCSLRCIFCQNHEIAVSHVGYEITPDALVQTMLRLEREGVHNINLVTPSHYTVQLIPVLKAARCSGLHIPFVWNSSGYENVESLRLLDGLIDIYLPDFKYIDSNTAAEYADAPDYPETAKRALAEMVRQCGAPVIDPQTGLMTRGVQVRHLVLPGSAQESRRILYYLHQTYGNGIGYSIMNQYTPMPQMRSHPLLSRRVTAHEYDTVVRYARMIGIENAYTQEGGAAEESFIPAFSGRPD